MIGTTKLTTGEALSLLSAQARELTRLRVRITALKMLGDELAEAVDLFTPGFPADHSLVEAMDAWKAGR